MKTKFKPGDALLIVDPQIDFMPDGALGVPEGDKILPIVNEWIDAAEQTGIPIIISRDWHPPDHISFKEQGGSWPPHCVRDTKGAAFHPDLHIPKNVIISSKATHRDKEAYSAFEGMIEDHVSLRKKLHTLKIKRIWIAGLALDYCVYQSAISAHNAGLELHVILPATRAISKENANKVLEDMKKKGAIIENNRSSYACHE